MHLHIEYEFMKNRKMEKWQRSATIVILLKKKIPEIYTHVSNHWTNFLSYQNIYKAYHKLKFLIFIIFEASSFIMVVIDK